MPYLNLDIDYFDHPKTKRLVGILGRGAEVLPIKLWSYCGKFHADDGKLINYSDFEIEALAGWWGKSGEMLPAMVKVGFIKKTNAGYEVHEWLDHEGHISAFKIRSATANAARWSKINDPTRSPTRSPCYETKDSSYYTNLPNQPNPQVKTASESVLKRLEVGLSRAYRRPADSPWTDAEQCALAAIARRPDAIAELDRLLLYRSKLSKKDERFFPNSIGSLLSKWTDKIDQANTAVKPAPIKSTPPQALKGQAMDAEKVKTLGNATLAKLREEMSK